MRNLKLLSSIPFLLALFITLIQAACQKDDDYENVPIEYIMCPCELEMSFITEIKFDKILLFDSIKTTLPDMRVKSSNGEDSQFICYSPATDSAVLYIFKEIRNITYTSIGYVCNFPKGINWSIPSSGKYISFTADVFESCNSLNSVGFTSTYTDNILTSFKIYKK